jgi:UDP-glucose 4-epimerase
VAHLNALERLTAKKNKERFEVFNLGTGKGYSVLEVIKCFEKVTATKLNYRIGAKRPGDVSKVFSDCKRSNSVLGWKAEQPLEQMLLSAWEWEQKI